MKNTFPSISVIIPVYNEEENISPLLASIYSKLGCADYELIMVDDGSLDKTNEKICQHKNSQTKLITLSTNYGQSTAIKAGIDNSSKDYIVILDGDLQNDPNDIPKLFSHLLQNNYNLVQGYRKNRYDSLQKKIPSKIANKIINLLFKFPIKDIGCAIKVFDKKSLDSVHYFNGFHRYLSLIIHLNGLKVGEIEVTHRPRIYGKSKYGIKRFKEVIYHLGLFKTKSIQKLQEIDYNLKTD